MNFPHCAAISTASIAITLIASAPIVLVAANPLRDEYNAIIRGDVSSKTLALVFTGDEHTRRGYKFARVDELLERDSNSESL